MDDYFPIILTQNIILCIVTGWFVFRSTVLNQKEKIMFQVCLVMSLFIAVFEFIFTAAEGKADLIWLQQCTSFCYLALIPLLPAIPVLLLSKRRIAYICSLIPVGVNLLLLCMGKLFYIAADGSYTRSTLFWVYTSCYLCNMLYLTFQSLLFSIKHQHNNAAKLLLISIFMISSTTIQLRHIQIHVSWFCVAVTILLYFFYYTEVMQQMDSLTSLLNRSSFKEYSARHRNKISGVIMIDLDNFKTINDTYGHQVGDYYLEQFAICLRKVFQRFGYCYRLGGDEFCVLLDNIELRFTPDEFAKSLQECCKEIKSLPQPISFSYGYESLREHKKISDAINKADQTMYACKAMHKQGKLN